MNSVQISGRLTKDPEVKYTSGTQTAVVQATIAIDEGKDKDGKKQTQFPRVVVFGKQAESLGKYTEKGCRIEVTGRIVTGSYKNKNGDTVWTTDILASRVEFIDFKKKQENAPEEPAGPEDYDDVPDYAPF